MPVQSPDFAPRWVLGSLPEDPAEFQRVLAGRLHGLEAWVRAAHARINFTQPFILGPVVLPGGTYNPAAGVSNIPGLVLSFTSAIRAQALVLLNLDGQATAVRGDLRGRISVNGAADIANGPVLAIETANDELSSTAAYGVQLAAATAYTIQAKVNVTAGTWTLMGRSSISLVGVPLSYTLP